MKNEHWAKHAQVKQKCSACGMSFNKLKETKHASEHVLCDNCERSLLEVQRQQSAVREQQINADVQARIICDFCGNNFQDLKELKLHVKLEHPLSYVIFKAKLLELKTRHNKEMTIKKQNMQTQIKSNELKVYECPVDECSKRVYSMFGMKNHIRKRHESSEKVCGSSIPSPNVTAVPQESKLNTKQYTVKGYQCSWPGCDEEFQTERNLKVHLILHKDEKPLKCDLCDYRCRQQNAMQWHTRKHHPEASGKRKTKTEAGVHDMESR